MPTVLLTGFAPFGRWSVNSSDLAIARLMADATASERRRWRAARLPVDHGKAAAALERAIEDIQPDAVLSVGLAAGGRLRVETSARPSPAAQTQANPFRRAPPERICAAVARRLRADGNPTALSRNAGRYVCETVYRTALDRCARGGAPKLGLFLHVPPLSGRWTERRLAACLRAALEVVEAEVSRGAPKAP